MKNLFIIGNGMDINVGLKTSYSNFFNDELKLDLLLAFKFINIKSWEDGLTNTENILKNNKYPITMGKKLKKLIEYTEKTDFIKKLYEIINNKKNDPKILNACFVEYDYLSPIAPKLFGILRKLIFSNSLNEIREIIKDLIISRYCVFKNDFNEGDITEIAEYFSKIPEISDNLLNNDNIDENVRNLKYFYLIEDEIDINENDINEQLGKYISKYISKHPKFIKIFNPKYNKNYDKDYYYNTLILYIMLYVENDSDWYQVEKCIEKVVKYIADGCKDSLHSNEIMNNYFKGEFKNFYELKSNIDEIEEKFGKYIESQNKDASLESIKIYLKQILKLDENDNIDMSKIEIFNFNYTTYMNRLFKNVANIHGDFKKPIFGIEYLDIENNDDESNELPEHMNFTKTARILYEDTNSTTFNLPKIDEIDRIYFFGHSLLEADYSYFNSIFDYYDIYSSSVKLVFLYTEFQDGVRKTQMENIIRLINKYGKTLDNKNKGKNMLHKLILEKRLILKKVDNFNLTNYSLKNAFLQGWDN
ncbi:AbiH family protein [Oceanivirga salmonicida]|uniref:AbiH family protein n=1 Tax=Oceanivirga salmonicida TaxID=1769291 RepID=UPI0012E1E5D5|nr:AbiH family protein [Oceanivirga salmonicida]